MAAVFQPILCLFGLSSPAIQTVSASCVPVPGVSAASAQSEALTVESASRKPSSTDSAPLEDFVDIRKEVSPLIFDVRFSPIVIAFDSEPFLRWMPLWVSLIEKRSFSFLLRLIIFITDPSLEVLILRFQGLHRVT